MREIDYVKKAKAEFQAVKDGKVLGMGWNDDKLTCLAFYAGQCVKDRDYPCFSHDILQDWLWSDLDKCVEWLEE